MKALSVISHISKIMLYFMQKGLAQIKTTVIHAVTISYSTTCFAHPHTVIRESEKALPSEGKFQPHLTLAPR